MYLRAHGIAIPVILLSLLSFNVPVHADDASLGRVGEAVRPVAGGQVVMVSEKVVVTVSGPQSRVEAVFNFRNEGEGTTVLMGFPEPEPQRERGEFGDDFRLHDFKAVVDGVAVPAKRERGLLPGQGGRPDDYPWWYTFSVPFEPGQERQVLNSYWVKNNSWSNGDTASGYILVTGASWKGSIGEVEVRLRLADGIMPYHLLNATPTSYVFEGTDLVWRWYNLEPDRNIRFLFNTAREFIAVENALKEGSRDFLVLLRNREYRPALELIEAASQGGELSLVDQKVMAYARARLLYLMGEEGEAVSLWEQLRQEVRLALPRESFYPDHVAGAPYYHLGTRFALAGRLKELVGLYREAKDKRINPQVVRYLESLLPEGERGNSPPVIRELVVVPEVPGGESYRLGGVVFDPDGDLDEIKVEVWQTVNGKRMEVKVPQPEERYFQEYEGRFEVPLVQAQERGGMVVNEPIKEGIIEYRVRIADGRGGEADTGLVRWSRDNTPAQPGGTAGRGQGSGNNQVVRQRQIIGIVTLGVLGVAFVIVRRVRGRRTTS